MSLKEFTIGFMISFSLIIVMVLFHTSTSRAQAIVGPPTPGPRFWMSDFTHLGGDSARVAYMVHDNKIREVCYLVVESNISGTGIAMTPRQC